MQSQLPKSSPKQAPTAYQGHTVRKQFGQHFLVDQVVINRMIAAISPEPGDHLVEIGAGLGALTAPLLNAVGSMDAIEVDRDLVAHLKKRFGSSLTLYEQDVLSFDFNTLVAYPMSSPKLRIVGNLPYYLSSPLLFHLTTYAPRVIDQHLMLQKEVVDRMVASPGSKMYGRLSVMLQYRYAMDKLFDVAPNSFSPAPKVDSAIVRMVPYAADTLPKLDDKRFSSIVRSAFSQRRKILRNSLAAYRSQIDFDAIHFDLTRRAEEVPVSDYVRICAVN